MLYFNKKGRYQKQYEELLNLLVPRNGEKADTVQGRLIQAISVLSSDYRRNGSDHWKGTYIVGDHTARNPALGYHRLGSCLLQHLRDKTIFDYETLKQIEQDYELMKMHGEQGCNFNYTVDEDVYDRMTDRVIEFCRARPELEWLDQTTEHSPNSIAYLFK